MKLRKWLAIALAGVLVMQMPVTVRADNEELNPYCKWEIAPHIENYKVTTADGQLTVEINVKAFEGKSTGFSLFAFENQLEASSENHVSEAVFAKAWGGGLNHPKEIALFDKQKSGTYTFTGLAGGKTYYVYCCLYDSHNDSTNEDDANHEGAMYLGSGTPTGSSNSSSSGNSSGSSNSKSAWASYEETMNNQIEAAPSGSTIVMEKGISALSNSMMKELLKKGDVSLKLEFTYNDVEYVIIIPAGAALDNDIPWYGPLYLAERFGNSAGTAAAPVADVEAATVATGEAYAVKSGDTMGRIAAANDMTLAELLAKNPQIQNPNKIAVGQKINL